MTTGKIFLSGGGDEHASEILDRQFFKEIPLGGKILYIATGFREDERYLRAYEWMQGVIKLQARRDVTFQMDNDLTLIKHLVDFDALYIAGCDIDILMDEFDRTGFEFVIKNFSEHGGTVYGGGVALSHSANTSIQTAKSVANTKLVSTCLVNILSALVTKVKKWMTGHKNTTPNLSASQTALA